MNRQVKRIVRTLEVKAVQEHMRIITGKPFVAAPSEINGLMYSGLIALHKMRTRWVRRPRSRPARPGCAAKGGPGSSTSRRGTVYAFSSASTSGC